MFHVKRRLERRRRWAVALVTPPEPGWPGGEIIAPLRRAWTIYGAVELRARMLCEPRWEHSAAELVIARLDRHAFVVASWSVSLRGQLVRREVSVG